MIEEMNYLTTLDTQPDEVKLRNLIETFADAFYHRMSYASEQEFNMGFTRRQAIVKYNNVKFEVTEDYTTDENYRKRNAQNVHRSFERSQCWNLRFVGMRPHDE